MSRPAPATVWRVILSTAALFWVGVLVMAILSHGANGPWAVGAVFGGVLLFVFWVASDGATTAAERRAEAVARAEQEALGKLAPGSTPGTHLWTYQAGADGEWLREQFELARQLTDDDHRRLMEEL